MDYQIENQSPCSLDDVIRANRDKCRLAFATDDELQKLNGGVFSDTPSRPDVTDWQIIVMHIRQDDGSAVDYAFLVGWCLDTRGPLSRPLSVVAIGLSSGTRCDPELPYGMPVWNVGWHSGSLQETIKPAYLAFVATGETNARNLRGRRANQVSHKPREIRAGWYRVSPLLQIECCYTAGLQQQGRRISV